MNDGTNTNKKFANYLDEYLDSLTAFEDKRKIDTENLTTRPKKVERARKGMGGQPSKLEREKKKLEQQQATPPLRLDYSVYLTEAQRMKELKTIDLTRTESDKVIRYQDVNLFNICPNLSPVKKKTVYEMSFEEEKAFNNKAGVMLPLLKAYNESLNDKGYRTFTPFPNRFSSSLDPNNFKFYNTSLISSAANYFKKFKVYCDETPLTNEARYDEFWDRWTHRRKNGITLPIRGHVSGGNSDKDLIDLWVPGKMVGMLNFGKMTKTNSDGKAIDNTLNFDEIMNAGMDLQRSRGISDEELSQMFTHFSDRQVVNLEFDFPDFWDGHYMYWILAEFCKMYGLSDAVLKARRKGLTYLGAWDVFDEIDLYPRTKCLLIAHLSEYLTSSNGLMKFIKDYDAFISVHTEWSKQKLVSNITSLEYGYYDKGSLEPKGFRSGVDCLSAKDNPNCARGKQSKVIKYEECGSFPNLYETNQSTKSATESGNFIVGRSSFWGTASTKDAEFGGFSKILKSPVGNGILVFDWGIFEPKHEGKAMGFFFPQTLNLEGGGMDEQGNSDMTKALKIHYENMYIVKSNSRPEDSAKWVAERPLRPSDVINTISSNSFSKVAHLVNDQIDYLQSEELYSNHKDGEYRITSNGEVKFLTNEELKEKGESYHPFIYEGNDFLGENFDLTGCIREYEPPIMIDGDDEDVDKSGVVTKKKVVPEGIYWICHDPYAVDKNKEDITKKDSLGVAYVYMVTNKYDKSAMGRIVASYIGRPPKTSDYNSQLYLLAKRYNCIRSLAFENDRGEVQAYFASKNALKYLAYEPLMNSFKGSLGKATGRVYGFSMAKHPDRKREGVRMLLDFVQTEIASLDSTFVNNRDKLVVTRIRLIPCVRLLREFLKFNYEGNFDCISALLILMYYLRELEDIETNLEEPYKEDNLTAAIFNSDFFKNN
jgi:hypothetical protein